MFVRFWRGWWQGFSDFSRQPMTKLGGFRPMVEPLEDRLVLTSLSITPSPATVVVGATQQFQATEVDDLGNSMDVTQRVAWYVDPQTGQGTIDSAFSGAQPGLFTGTSAGTVSVRAVDDQIPVEATDTVTVIDQVTTTVTANTGLTVAQGDTATLDGSQLAASGSPGDPPSALIYLLTAAPTHGTLQLNGSPLRVNGTFTQDDVNTGKVSYTQDGSATAGDSFAFAVADGSGTSATGVFSITILPHQADLQVGTTVSSSAAAGTDLTYTITLTNLGPNDAQSVSLSDPLPAGTTFVSETHSNAFGETDPGVGNGGTVTYTTDTLTAGASASFTVTVHLAGNLDQGMRLTSTATATTSTPDPTPGDTNNVSTVTTTVTPPTNQSPVANSFSVTLTTTTLPIAVLGQATDPDGNPLTVSAVTQGANGQVTINRDGTVNYTPTLFFSGTDSFTYTVSDGAGGTATGTVTVRVEIPPAQGITIIADQVKALDLSHFRGKKEAAKERRQQVLVKDLNRAAEATKPRRALGLLRLVKSAAITGKWLDPPTLQSVGGEVLVAIDLLKQQIHHGPG
jgi:uncharacterized repeat protein (TIGR01451 family)